MKLTEEINKILTENERKKYVKNNILDFGNDTDAIKSFTKRWIENFNKNLEQDLNTLKAECPEAFGE